MAMTSAGPHATGVAGRTEVGIVGAGPAGLMLSHLLHREGIQSVVLEARQRDYVERRVRAGVLEPQTVDLLVTTGVGERMRREGLVHGGVILAFAGERHRIDLRALTGRSIVIYGQQEVVKDLIAARLASGGKVHFGAEAVAIDTEIGRGARIRYRRDGLEAELHCDFVAGCDGSHGICRASIPTTVISVYRRTYPFAWLGILAATVPVAEEQIRAYHERGFALHSMRTRALSRLYLEVDADDRPDRWPDDLVWEELRHRLCEPGLRPGRILEKGMFPLQSMVAEPMQHGRLFVAGDAAHVVPPAGAKGMNLAMADVKELADALVSFYRDGSEAALHAYSTACLARVWHAERFSNWMTTLFSRAPDGDLFEHRLKLSHLQYLTHSRAAAASFAENYVGLWRS